MLKLKPLLERWLIDVDKESNYLNNETNESFGVSSSTNGQVLCKGNYNESANYDSNITGSSSSSSPSATVSTSSSWLVGLENNLAKRRKKRTSIETGARIALEKAFVENQKPTSEDIATLSDQLFMEREVVSFFKSFFLFDFFISDYFL